ncbi:MAG: hypothetical protein M3458_11830 [Acidobacteriota bacterium]|nr:hypothetical protein [Acidobacteriota bacterium]
MAIFVHLTSGKNLKAILRNGITRIAKREIATNGVYALPVTRNYYISHQWLRELKRRNEGPIAAVYFRIRDDTPVLVGRYNQDHQQMSAAEAVATMMNCENREGYEVIVPRKIARNEIHRYRMLSQVIGWRYSPESHGRKPCGCPYCQRGEYGGRKLREAYEKELNA